MEAIPWWAATFEGCWLQIVLQTWCNVEWLANSQNCRGRKQLMTGPAHRQGNVLFAHYKKRMEVKQKKDVSDLAVYVAARKGPEEGVLCNDWATQVMGAYTYAAKEKNGPDFDVMNEPLDVAAVYKAGVGKKHGRYMIGDGFIDSRASISEGRQTMSTSTASTDICPPRRVRTSTDKIHELESKLEQMQQILLSLQEKMNGNLQIANTPVTLLSTPGTVGSIGNTRDANGDGRDDMISPLDDHVDESNGDIRV